MWVCTRHKNINQKSLEKFQQDIKNKYNLDFGLIVNIPILAPVESVEGNDDSPVIDVSSSVDVSTTTSVDASSDFVDSSSIEEIPSVNSSNKSKSSPKNKLI